MSLLHREKKIIDAASERTGDLDLFVNLLKDTDLEDLLNEDGPFTVFMPIDGAVDNLPFSTAKILSEDMVKLAEVVKYHVVNGKITARDAIDMKGAKTLQGRELMFDAHDGFKVNGAKVVEEDIGCKNGIIHAIDTVLMPPD